MHVMLHLYVCGESHYIVQNKHKYSSTADAFVFTATAAHVAVSSHNTGIQSTAMQPTVIKPRKILHMNSGNVIVLTNNTQRKNPETSVPLAKQAAKRN